MTYTTEILDAIKATYTANRTAGRKNMDILAELAAEYETTIPSIRTKLMLEKVYVKDTDAEKATKGDKPKAAKEKGETKLQKAKRITTKLNMKAELAEDVAKMKAETLDALIVALAEKEAVAA